MKHVLLSFAVIVMPYLLCTGCSSKNMNRAFRPGEIWTDTDGVPINAHGGGILKVGDTYYWYGEHKTEETQGNVANVGVRCYSSVDLYNWKNEGVALSVSDNPDSPIVRGCILERPKVIYNKKNDNYVMWFHLEPKGGGYSGAMSGVAVSDSPTGPFTFLKALRPNAGEWPLNMPENLRRREVRLGDGRFTGASLPMHPDSMNLVRRDLADGQMARDMNLFVDEDGKAYHIYSSEENSTLHISLLDEDYTSHAKEYTRNFPGRFMEAPAIFKKDGRYYLIMSGCTGWAPNQARSAVADNILCEWTELGDPCAGDETHTTFRSQSTCVLQVGNRFIFMADRWNPDNAIDGRYVWLPLTFEDGRPVIRWVDEWEY